MDTVYKRVSIGKEKAIALAESKFYEAMSARDIAIFQMTTEELCMPFDVFQESVQEALGAACLDARTRHELRWAYEGATWVLRQLLRSRRFAN